MASFISGTAMRRLHAGRAVMQHDRSALTDRVSSGVGGWKCVL